MVESKHLKAVDKIEKFQRFGSVLGLERIKILMERLGNPQDDLKVIHVAGTNGKGSICKYLYNCLRAGGYKVGLYTSPYLEVFNERIELDGNFISDEDLEKYTSKVLAQVDLMVEEGLRSPTEFEVITAIAFLYFKEKGCDFLVLEVGLGGRGDSTNIVKQPLASVIASISLDHTERLGNTLGEIAGEKAGIIKDRCPVITSAESDEALRVIERVCNEHSAMYFETRNIPYEITEETPQGVKFNADIQGVEYEDFEISMSGEHQVKNAIAAITTLNLLEERGEVKLSREALYKGLKEAKQIGRFEVMTKAGAFPCIVLDGAHNPDGALSLKNAMQKLFPGKKVLMVVGILGDKDVSKVVGEFIKITKDFIVTEPENPRRMPATELANKLEQLGGSCLIEADYKAACELGGKRAKDYDVLLFAGSLYLIGGVRTIVKNWRGNNV